MTELARFVATVWFRPRDVFEELRDDEPSLASSAMLAGVWALLSGAIVAARIVPMLQDARAAEVAGVALQVALAPFGFGTVLWVAARVLGGRDATWPQAVGVAALLTALYPIALLLQAISFRVGGMPAVAIAGIAVPLAVGVVYASLGLVHTLEASGRATAILGGLATFGVLGMGAAIALVFGAVFEGSVRAEEEAQAEHQRILTAAREQAALQAEEHVAPDEPVAVVELHDDEAAAAPEEAAADEDEDEEVAAPEEAAPAAPTPPPDGWVVDCETVPPGARIEDAATGVVLGTTPRKLNFPKTVEQVELRLILGAAVKTARVTKGGDPFLIVAMPMEDEPTPP